MEIIRTPFRAPNVNAYAERWVWTLREECLDRLIMLNQSHLRRISAEYSQYYNEQRPHQGLEGATPLPLNLPVIVLLFVDVTFWGASFTITIARRNRFF